MATYREFHRRSIEDPENFWADLDYVYGRFAAAHVASFAAELDGGLVGCNFATRWGSVGFFGPVAVRPDRQGRGIAKSLVEAAVAQLCEARAIGLDVGMEISRPRSQEGVRPARGGDERHAPRARLERARRRGAQREAARRPRPRCLRGS